MANNHTDTHLRREVVPIPVPEGHPIHILMREHELVLDFADRLLSITDALTGVRDLVAAAPHVGEIEHLLDHLMESESHYVREENVLFPVIEKRGITEPPKMMWMEHDQIRALKKELAAIVKEREKIPFEDFRRRLSDKAGGLTDLLGSHFGKENSVLFPAALRVIPGEEWEEIRRQFDDLGYCCFTPTIDRAAQRAASSPDVRGGEVSFETGVLSVAELGALLDSLPVDITFVDKDDTVRYFNQAADRIFPRAKAIIGRTVQNCHPAKSIDKVQAILDGFRDGTLPKAEFWIPVGEKLVYIRYLPVRDGAGAYLGCLEVTQDIAPIKKIEGQKRLL